MSSSRPNGDPGTEHHGLRVEAFHSLAAAAHLAAQLDALNLSSRRPSPFDTFAYLQTFVAHDEHETPGQSPLLLVAFDGEAPVGWLALRRVPERLWGIPYQSIRLLASHDSDRPRAVSRAEDEARCCRAFYRHLFDVERGWSLLLLNEQDADSALLRPPDLDPRCYHLRLFPNNPNGTIDLSGSSLAGYLKTFSKTHRRNAERWIRRLVEMGDLEVVSTQDPRALPALLDLYLDLERRSWKAKVGGHIGRSPTRVAFFRRLLDPGQPMKVQIHLLLLDGVPIAGFVSGVFEGGLYGLEIAFDDGYRSFSPGNAMLLLVARDAFEKRYRFLDLLGNYAYYKSRWHATITETHAVQIFRKGSLIHLKAALGELRRRLRMPVSQRDVEFNLARKDAADASDAAEHAALPERAAERARARAALGAVEASGAALSRLRGEALARALPFETPRTRAGVHLAEGAH